MFPNTYEKYLAMRRQRMSLSAPHFSSQLGADSVEVEAVCYRSQRDSWAATLGREQRKQLQGHRANPGWGMLQQGTGAWVAAGQEVCTQ